MLKNLLIGLIIATISNAGANDVFPIKKGEPSPIQGVVFTESKANEIRKEILDSDINKVRLESSQERISILQSVIKLREGEVESLRAQNRRVINLNKVNNASNTLYFILGIVVAGASVYGARSLSK
jgi:hypothetical protein